MPKKKLKITIQSGIKCEESYFHEILKDTLSNKRVKTILNTFCYLNINITEYILLDINETFIRYVKLTNLKNQINIKIKLI
jgi:hypothetical protein